MRRPPPVVLAGQVRMHPRGSGAKSGYIKPSMISLAELINRKAKKRRKSRPRSQQKTMPTYSFLRKNLKSFCVAGASAESSSVRFQMIFGRKNHNANKNEPGRSRTPRPFLGPLTPQTITRVADPPNILWIVSSEETTTPTRLLRRTKKLAPHAHPR